MVKQWKKSLDGDDVQAEAEDALEKDIANMSPASNSVAGNLDGGIAAVDWSNKTPKRLRVESGTSSDVSVTGSGYLISIAPDYPGNEEVYFTLEIDGTELFPNNPFRISFNGGNGDTGASAPTFMFRFESGFTINTSGVGNLVVFYVLD
jgi:hypothetical protein